MLFRDSLTKARQALYDGASAEVRSAMETWTEENWASLETAASEATQARTAAARQASVDEAIAGVRAAQPAFQHPVGAAAPATEVATERAASGAVLYRTAAPWIPSATHEISISRYGRGDQALASQLRSYLGLNGLLDASGRALMSDGTNPAVHGNVGHSLPAEIRSEFLRARVTKSRYAGSNVVRVIGNPTGNLKFPVAELSTQFTDDTRNYRLGEEIDEREGPSVGERKFGAHEYADIVRLPNELLRVSTSVDWINVVIDDASTYSANRRERMLFSTLPGTDSPMGIRASTSGATRYTFDATKQGDVVAIEKMFTHVLVVLLDQAHSQNAEITVSPQMYAYLDTLYVPGGNLKLLGTSVRGDTLVSTIKGRPVYISRGLPEGAKSSDICIWDPKQYIVAEHQEFDAETDASAGFTRNQTLVRCLEQWDAKVGIGAGIVIVSGLNFTGAI